MPDEKANKEYELASECHLYHDLERKVEGLEQDRARLAAQLKSVDEQVKQFRERMAAALTKIKGLIG